MKIASFWICFLALLILGCKKDTINLCHDDFCLFEYTLSAEPIKGNIIVEQFENNITDENRYNANNSIYQICKNLTYKYYHKDSTGTIFFYEKSSSGAWDYVSENEKTEKTIIELEVSIEAGQNNSAVTDQTAFTFSYKK